MDNIGELDLVNHSEYKKSAIFMRISDDVLSLLEKYALNQNGSSSKLTIKFDDSNGVIKMPNGEIFSFSITGSTAGYDSTYCVQETENRKLEAVALVQRQKIIIKPGVNSFEKTRSRLTHQRKVNLCREIEMPNSFIRSKKVTVKCSSTFPGAPNSIIINGNENKRFIPYKDFDIVSQCIRKRIIHMLALKPYKRSELLDRLMKEGISEFDKSQVFAILYFVGTFNGKLFHLHTKLWKEVEDDWKFYSAKDAAIVKKRKQEACQTDKSSFLDEIVANSAPIPKQKKTRVTEKKPGLCLAQYEVMNSTSKNCSSPASESKESNYQVISFPSFNKKHKKKRERKRGKMDKSSLSNSDEKSSTVINKTNHVLEDFSTKCSLVDEMIANSGPIQRKQKKTRVKEENPDLRLVQYGMMNSTPKNCPSPASESKESNHQVTSPPSSYKKHKKNRERKRKKNKKLLFSLNNSSLASKPSQSTSTSLPSQSAFASSFSHSAFASSSQSPSAPSSTQSPSAPSSSQSPAAPSFSQSSAAFSFSQFPSAYPPSHSTSAPSFSQSASASSSLQSASVSSSYSASVPSFSQSASASSSLQSASVSSSYSTSVPSFSQSPSAPSSFQFPSAPSSSHSPAAPSFSQSSAAPSFSQSSFVPPPSQSPSASPPSYSTSAPSFSQSASVSSSSNSPSSHSILCSMYKILTTESADHDANDFRRKFCKITSFEQRDRYKEIFDFECPLYDTLKEIVMGANERMTHLEEKLKTLSEGTQEYDAALMALFQVYKMYFQNTCYKECSRLMYHLHEKLFYIRNLIHEFDIGHS
ncbi:RNA polymerase II elongation factor ELL2-like isoform X2 [Argiope bruennichi]|uniref:RNA polymerase II elongation factor ELL2-like isoform X2 n=1 Tax=Argiope bruennichi TaxID=94029 RepID=UPI0024953634|nr:RNA polymerase II elongation factor ELL2-like isoform X2 [Argiope bruennichi]